MSGSNEEVGEIFYWPSSLRRKGSKIKERKKEENKVNKEEKSGEKIRYQESIKKVKLKGKLRRQDIILPIALHEKKKRKTRDIVKC